MPTFDLRLFKLEMDRTQEFVHFKISCSVSSMQLDLKTMFFSSKERSLFSF